MTSTPNAYHLSIDAQKPRFSVQDHRFHENSPLKPSTCRQIRGKYRKTIENFIKIDTEARELEQKLSASKERLKKQEKLGETVEKQKRLNDRRLLIQKARYSEIQRDREEEMKNLDERLRKTCQSTSGSRSNSFIKWRERSKEKLEKIRNEEERYMLLKLDLYSKKQSESDHQHKVQLEKKSKKMFQLNSKVEKIRNKMLSFVDQTQNYFEVINKSNSISCKQQKVKSDIGKKLELKKKLEVEKKLRMNMNIVELLQNNARKEEKLEEKHNKSFQTIQQKRNDWEIFLENKQERDRVRYEKSMDALSQKRKVEYQTKLEIIQKHIETNNKLKMRKTSMEMFKQKRRGASMKDAMERDKVKHIKFVISKSKDPIDASKILSIYSNK